jgi:hypothetical protein
MRAVLKRISAVPMLEAIAVAAVLAITFACTKGSGQTPAAPQTPAVAPIGDLKVRRASPFRCLRPTLPGPASWR